MKTLIGIVTFGNTQFSRLTVDEIYRTTTRPFELAVIVGKPGDQPTINWCEEQRSKRGIHFAIHEQNKGFAGSINDLYDFAWANGFDQVIFVGNDVIAYPGCIDGLIDIADTTDWEMICASMLDVQSLCAGHPEARRFFNGPTYQFNDFGARPWDLQTDFRSHNVEPDTLKDVRNMTLFKRSAFDKVGYADVSFWPNGYYEDNCTARRCNLTGVKACGASHCAFFHFWSRTIHESGENRPHGKYFDRNGEFYRLKWGGAVNEEKYALPFNGQPHAGLIPGVTLPATLKIESRADEPAIINYWRTK